ncbi:hypothetical protein IAR55_006615 [Kwoniella newhampshirensis]|uniref:Calcium-activated chloride channel-domain-containing protein n=1 Tax=Kwoniella newhampshirensis TaxID=1651941 RepID=A0AAW0YFN3_9TREE
MVSPTTPQRVTRSMSHQPSPAPPTPPSLEPPTPTSSAATAPGPPVANRDSSLTQAFSPHLPGTAGQHYPSNPYQVDFVIPFSIAVSKGQDRQQAQREIKTGYEELLRALEGEGGLKVASKGGRGGKGQEEVWIFVGASEEKVNELVEREKQLDESHNLPPHSHHTPPSPATRIRLLYNLLTAPALQNGLGITPGKGKWSRVKSIMALHDEEADRTWVEKWTVGGDWRVGLLMGLEDGAGTGLGHHQPPPVHLYFDFLTTYTLSLLPLSVISALFYLLTPSDSYPPLYAFLLSIYATAFVAIWRIKERKLAVRWGTHGCESVAVGRLRPEYVANMGWDKEGDGTSAVDAVQAGNDLKRDTKVAISVPVIAACGVGLGVVLMGIFVLEAFVGQVYDGVGKEVVPLIPTALFAIVVPQIVALYHRLSTAMVAWEDHPTPVGAEKSLTAKTFAMNGIVAYLGLFLSAYVYVPFGSFIMAHVQQRMTKQDTVQVVGSPEKAGLGPMTSGQKQKSIKAGRLKGQLFAYTVTNQVINSFLELGMPYLMRFVNDWRAGKTTIKETIQRRGSDENEKPPTTDEEVEKRFLNKVERELALPDYSLFTDYAEMVTQFGYVTIWSIVWPIAPVFALINNYVEMRSDALKICKHVRRPVGDRVETIGSWLDTLSIISWIGAVTNATLIYLFRPSTAIHDQTPNPHVASTSGSSALSYIVSNYYSSPTLQTLLPTLIPLGLVALAASHGFIVLRWIVEGLAERILWRGSDEQVELQKLSATRGEKNELARSQSEKGGRKDYGDLRGGFWNGGEEGAREIGRVIKAE